MNCSKKNSSGLLFIDLIIETKSLSKIDLVDISTCDAINWLLTKEFIGI